MKISLKLVKRKECTVLTWPAKLLLLSLLVTFFCLVFFRIPFFLSKNDPVNGDYLLLDGQMPDFSIKNAIKIFNESNYKTIITTGGKFPSGYIVSGKKNMAELTYATFIELGFDSAKIVAIQGGDIPKDRTYHSGLSLKNWFSEHNIGNAEIDILAVGCHARRSQILFQKALGDNFKVGIIAIEDKSYDNKKWWKTSTGARNVISETIAFIYASLFFNPKTEFKKK
jgi:hypothetical protein